MTTYMENLIQEADAAFREAGFDLELALTKHAPVAAQVSIVAGPAGHNTRVLVNGVDVSKFCSGFTIRGDVNEPISVNLELPAVVADAYLSAALTTVDGVDRRSWWSRLWHRN